KAVIKIKQLMAESNAVINLHEMKEKDSAVIIDDKGLSKIAEKVIRKVNRADKKTKLVLWDYRTGSADSEHPEQKGSATYYAYFNHGTPAFGVDLSQKSLSLEDRVKMHKKVLDAFMDELGIERL
ncbi:MAG: hypothetical protein V1647_03780, partial [Pseudomonadota bacterium]